MFFFSVLIITSSINAPETIEVLNQLENLTHTKALLIDIIGSIFNNQNEFFQNLNIHKDNNSPTNSNNNLFVLTILSDRFKVFLNYSLPDVFEKLFNDTNVNVNPDVGDEFFRFLKNIFNRGKFNRTDDDVIMNIRKYFRNSCDRCGNSIRAHISFCENKVKRAQQSPSDGNIKSMCEEIFRAIDTRQAPSIVLDRNKTSLAIYQDDHPLFGAFFSLFDFIASATMHLPAYNDTNSKYDFIVLDFEVVNETKFAWKPFLLLLQSQIDHQTFHPLRLTHGSIPPSTSIYWTCGLQCWIITTLSLILFLISMVVSIAVGIAVR